MKISIWDPILLQITAVYLGASPYTSYFLICKLWTILPLLILQGSNDVKHIQSIFVKFQAQVLNKETDVQTGRLEQIQNLITELGP